MKKMTQPGEILLTMDAEEGVPYRFSPPALLNRLSKVNTSCGA
jgi:hypothetical protein